MRPETHEIGRSAGASRVRLVRYAPTEKQLLHAHPSASLTLILSGEIEERSGSKTAHGVAFDVVVKPAGVEHSDAFGPRGARTLQLLLSKEDETCTEDSGHRLGAWRWIRGGSVGLALLRVLASAASDGSTRGPRVAGAELDALLAEVLAAIDPPAPRRGGHAPCWLLRVRSALEEDSIPIGSLALSQGVHPVHLAREFRRHFGTAPTAYRRDARVRRAVSSLAASPRGLAEAAVEAGYADQAHMTRELHQALGATPGAVRDLLARLHRPPLPPPSPASTSCSTDPIPRTGVRQRWIRSRPEEQRAGS
jgi:AraC family transcriptional regulator